MANIEDKIPCSISIITRGEGLEAPLEALKDFAEVVVCHGNPAGDKLEPARRLGAKLLPQYDTDEEGLTCTTDKAAVRQRAMEASTYRWRFFIDRDDRLSPELIEEIRTITTDPNPTHLVWRMPTRIFIDGREIKYEAAYPSYQTRLVHQSVGAYFKGPVHERLMWDEQKFRVGTMRSYYNFHWPKERAQNHWKYLRGYVDKELQVSEFPTFAHFVRWGLLFRVRVFLGYLLWRLPRMYLLHGFKDTMPFSIEVSIVRYHSALLWGSVWKFIRTRRSIVFLVETLRGKDLNRILCNLAVRHLEAYGRVLDVGGGHGASHWRFLRQNRWCRKIVIDLPHANPDIVADLERDAIPLADGHCDTALLFNVLEHINNREHLLAETRRVLKQGGSLVGVVPFLVAVHPDPHDFVRLTDQGLQTLLEKSGFTDIEITPVSWGPFAASYYQTEFLLPRVLKLLVLPCVRFADAAVLFLRPVWRHKFPLSYVFVAR